jgi:DNA (cytosine-5)-methyltransferase 1
VAGMRYKEILNEAWAQHLAPKPADAPTVVSTFAGCGGSSLGYSMAGFRELLAVEWEQNAADTFRLNFPEVPMHQGDIAKLSVQQCLDLAQIQPGELSVFDGSPPCQGFSTAGNRVLDDPRNSLFREFVRLLQGLRPKVFVMENVSGMVKGKMRLVFVDILRELKASGYKVSARLLNAKFFSVPQSRERMIFVGVRDDLGVEPSHPKPETGPITPRGAWDSVGGERGPELSEVLQRCAKFMVAGNYSETHTTKAFIQEKGKASGAMNTKLLSMDRCSCTIVKSEISGTGVIHPDRVHYLSIEEMARIGSFPDLFQFIGQRKDKVNRIGNSVPPLFMRAIARHIRSEILGI